MRERAPVHESEAPMQPNQSPAMSRTRLGLLAAGVLACAGANALGQFAANVLYDAPDYDLTDGLVDADPGTPGEQSTLRACIQNVNIQPPGVYTIIVPAGTYPLTVIGAYENGAATGDLDIANGVQILGAGVGASIVDASALGDRIFDIQGAYSVYFNDISLSGGTTPTTGAAESGGAIRQAPGGVLKIDQVEFGGCTASGGISAQGGAVYSEGSLEVRFGASFVFNHAQGHGGAAACAGSAHFDNVWFFQNSSDREGGAVRTASTSPMADFLGCRFESNTSGGAGGAINHRGPAEIDDCRFTGNDATAVGGAVNAFNSLTVHRTLFEGNHSASGGGAMNITGQTGARVYDSHFVFNAADTSGGAVTNAAYAEFWNTTFEENLAFGTAGADLGGGAIYSFRPLELINSTLTRNHAPNGLGGAILNLTGGTADLANVTINQNDALHGDSVCNGTPGGGASMRIDHTILSNFGSPNANCYGTSLPIVSIGFSFDSDGTSFIAGPFDIAGTPATPIDPRLAPLANTGGFAPTHELLPGSPCWDTGDVQSLDPFGNWIVEDQRHFGRPIGRVDRGAVEMTKQACRADYNGDGMVNTRDVLAFLNDWAAGDPRADMNGDGVVNTLDVLVFLNLWTQGCP